MQKQLKAYSGTQKFTDIFRLRSMKIFTLANCTVWQGTIFLASNRNLEIKIIGIYSNVERTLVYDNSVGGNKYRTRQKFHEPDSHLAIVAGCL